MRKPFEYDEQAYPITGAFAHLLRQPGNAQWCSEFFAGARFDIDEGFLTEDDAISEFREDVSARMPKVGSHGLNEPLVDWRGLYRFLEAATRPSTALVSVDGSASADLALHDPEQNKTQVEAQPTSGTKQGLAASEDNEDYVAEEARRRSDKMRLENRREERKSLVRIGLGFIFAIPILLGIGSLVLDALGVVVKNIGAIVSFLGFAVLFMGGLALFGKLTESGSHRPSIGSYVYPPSYPADWEQIRARVLQRDGRRCGNCAGTSNLHVHHIVPLSKGGSNSESNLRTLCKDCHALVHPHMRG